jgi:Pyruvate/2-oxoacid:ferredoxin oxidoreductase gamma subunit
MLGALLKAQPLASMDSVGKAIKERFPARIAGSNLEAVRLAHEKVTST